MRYQRQRGQTSNMVRIFIPDNTSVTGAGLTGLVYNSTNLVIAFIRELASSGTSYTGANIENVTTIGTYEAPSSSSKCRFKAVDATNFPGLYEIHFHNDATIFGSADAAQHAIINIYETTTTALKIGPNMCMTPLVPWNPQDVVRMGMTAIPNITVTTGAVATDVGNSATQIKTTLTNANNDVYNDSLIVLTSGTYSGDIKKITDYDGATKTITCTAFPATPADDVTFAIINK